jgi:hypothetical protein
MTSRNPFNNPFGGGTPGIRFDPRLDTTGAVLNTGGFTGQNPGVFGRLDTTAQTPITGRFLDFDKEAIKQAKDLFGDDMGALIYLVERQRAEQSNPQRMKEMLDVLGPYQKEVARENQRLGMESNLFAGFVGIPGKLKDARLAGHYYVPETMATIQQGINRPTPFLNRSYVSL